MRIRVLSVAGGWVPSLQQRCRRERSGAPARTGRTESGRTATAACRPRRAGRGVPAAACRPRRAGRGVVFRQEPIDMPFGRWALLEDTEGNRFPLLAAQPS
ncbi:hypothetical protein Aut01nite_66540 [Actinoplanes utahensis]|nr:hypothetical protein Aut01nite_66540 [Actinoplanes utahensis]